MYMMKEQTRRLEGSDAAGQAMLVESCFRCHRLTEEHLSPPCAPECCLQYTPLSYFCLARIILMRASIFSASLVRFTFRSKAA